MKVFDSFGKLRRGQRLFFVTFCLYILAILLVFFLKDLISAFLIAIIILPFAIIFRPLWSQNEEGSLKLRIFSITIMASAITFPWWESLVYNSVSSIIKNQFPSANFPPFLPDAVSYGTLLLLGVVVILINYLFRDKSVLGKSQENIDPALKEPDFKERVKGVCESLKDDLRNIDIKTRWSVKNFTPLDAEVETVVNGKRRRRITDLISAIKSSDDRLFLILGDPGSGKSVALRKFCQELCDEGHLTNKIPIYINLREWSVEDRWTELNPPTVNSLNDFIKNNIKSRDIVISKFFDRYYDVLYENGLLYFVLDSFDEIPVVLDVKEDSELIRKLSEVIFKFLKGARSGKSQGILASRIFSKPTDEFQASTIFEIRPFTEEKIIKTLRKTQYFDDKLIKEIFTGRADLFAIAKNPFSASLISEYLENNSNRLPQNQSELYLNYFKSQISGASERIREKQLDFETILSVTLLIADFAFKNYGLEVPVQNLKQQFPDEPIEKVVDVLQFSRIGRVSASKENFSFSHRRFCEYFVIQNFLDRGGQISLEDIPKDSGWRDALVLLCEIAEEKIAQQVANFCWTTIKNQETSVLESVHTLRFMIDAFRTRKECLQPFNTELYSLLKGRISGEKKTNMVYLKIMVEAIPLLNPYQMDTCLIASLWWDNSWINDTAFKSCRYLSKFSLNLERRIIDYIRFMPREVFFRLQGSLIFSLRLSSGLGRVRKYFYFKRLGLIVFIFSIVGLTFLFLNYISLYAIFLISIAIYKVTNIYGNRIRFYFGKIIRLIFFIWALVQLALILNSSKSDNFLFNWIKNNNLLLALTVIIIVINILFDYLAYNQVRNLNKTIEKQTSLEQEPSVTTQHVEKKIYIRELTSEQKKNRKDTAIKIALVLSGVILVVVLCILSRVVAYVVVGILFILGIYNTLFKNLPIALRDYRMGKRIYRSIVFAKTVDREYIYSIFELLRGHKRLQRKFIEYLEKNVKKVTGDFSNEYIRLHRLSDDNTIRLAQLEEKWLGLDR